MPRRIRASIVGITGYTGLELLRLLLLHPQVEIAHLTSRQHENEPIGNIFPHLAHLDLRIANTGHDTVAKDSDIVFLALPHGAAQDAVAALHGRVRLIDLSADFRADDPAVHEKYYGAHAYPHLLKEVVYGLPEVTDRALIKNAASVANPGCFALLGQLLLYPFKGMIERADIFAVTGSSGAGKTPGEGTHHPIRSHNMKSYNINAHRHIPEITRTAGIDESRLNFVPTSGPFTRGIFAQAFIHLDQEVDAGQSVRNRYRPEPFIRVMDSVALVNVTGSNFCDLSYAAGEGGVLLAQGAIDNLVKGAAGTAVQNMNLMFGFDETEGLITIGPVYP
jgi:N-acetyl-gamma-glutamyl-phosphate reductase